MSAVEPAIGFGTYAGGFGVRMLAITISAAMDCVHAHRFTPHRQLITRLAGILMILAWIDQLSVAVTITF